MRKIQRVGINFSTIAEAIAAASAGDLVQVLPGVYEESDVVLKNGVNIEFMPGAEMKQSAAEIAAESEYTAFTDDGNDVTCSIGGRPKFTFYGSTDLIELTGTSVVSFYGKPEYSYTDSLSWTSVDKLVFEVGPKVYRAKVTQSGTNIPVSAIVFDNTLGGVPVWTRVAAGQYNLTLAGAFGETKTFISRVDNVNSDAGLAWTNVGSVSDDAVQFTSKSGDGMVILGDGFFDCFLEIRVYP